jgi:hypothetical protein
MSILDMMSRTIKCDNESCTGGDENTRATVTFDPQNQEEISKLPDWLRTTRTVTLGNNTRFTYCSDVCEVKGVTTGAHNVPEPKQIQEATVAQAATVVKQAQAVEKLKTKPNKKIVSTEE